MVDSFIYFCWFGLQMEPSPHEYRQVLYHCAISPNLLIFLVKSKVHPPNLDEVTIAIELCVGKTVIKAWEGVVITVHKDSSRPDHSSNTLKFLFHFKDMKIECHIVFVSYEETMQNCNRNEKFSPKPKSWWMNECDFMHF